MKKLKKINNALLLSIVLVMLLACCMPFFATKIVLAEDEDAPRVYYLSDSIPTLSEDELVSMFGAVVTKEIFPDYDSGSHRFYGVAIYGVQRGYQHILHERPGMCSGLLRCLLDAGTA